MLKNKELEFRAWDGEEMHYEWLVIKQDRGFVVPTTLAKAAKNVMQFTGLYDVKHKKVFEGDIVRRSCMAKGCSIIHVGVVKYSADWCMFCLDENPSENFNGYLPPLAYGDPFRGVILGVEIVGNIYENPEALNIGFSS